MKRRPPTHAQRSRSATVRYSIDAFIEPLEPRRLLTSLLAQQVEYLNRGMFAEHSTSTNVYVDWRLLGTDPTNIAFNLYRSAGGGTPVKLNSSPITATTDFTDTTANLTVTNAYFVKPVINNVEQSSSETYTLPANSPVQIHLDIPLTAPPGGTEPASPSTPAHSYTEDANDTSVADVDGDGQYEIFLKWQPTDAQDNSVDGFTGDTYIDCYRLDGTRLWRIDLGKNIRSGAHYTQFLAYDFDGDGKAELVMKTAPGTIDGQGNPVLLPGDDVNADYRNSSGYVLTGPEYLTVFNGLTGAAMATVPFLPDRGSVSQWGDTYGNRVDRFNATVAYFDGQRPSIVWGRGYYNPQSTGGQARNEVAAWDWRNGQLTLRWWFKSGFNINNNINADYNHEGTHSIEAADVDGDGKDEIIYGASLIDDSGQPYWNTALGHGDALFTTPMDPSKPNDQMTFQVHETSSQYNQNGLDYGGDLRDDTTQQLLFNIPGNGDDVGRGNAFDIDPNHPGYELWDTSDGGIYNIDGTRIQDKPSNMFVNMGVWWDGDPGRELEDGTTISDWKITNGVGGRSNFDLDPATSGTQTAPNAASNNGTKSTPCLIADIFGDWREEVIWRKADNSALEIFSTNIPSSMRLFTLMDDVHYRESVSYQQSAYNQPTSTSFYMGFGMAMPPQPNIYIAGSPPAAPGTPGAPVAQLFSPSQVNLNWSGAPFGAAIYRVARSTTSGGPYNTIATGVVGTSYSDLNVPPGQTYYYVVSAISAAGAEGAVSAQGSISVPGVTTIYQAENATNGGGNVISTGNGADGSGYVDFSTTGGFTEFDNVNGGGGGTALLKIRFALGTFISSRTGWLNINGSRSKLTLQYTGANTTWMLYTTAVTLKPGATNTIRLESTGQDLPNIDELQIITNTNGAIIGTLYQDSNDDGVQDNGEPSLGPGILVYIDANNNNHFDPGESSALTDANGLYAIGNLQPGGPYTVRHVVPANYIQPTPLASQNVATGGSTTANMADEQIVYVGGSGSDQYELRKNPADKYLIYISNVLTYTVTAAAPSLSFSLAGGDDVMTINLANGAPIPAGGLTLDGGADGSSAGDQLAIVGSNGVADIAIFNAGSVTLNGVAEAIPNFERVSFDSNDGWDDVTINAGPTLTFPNPPQLDGLTLNNSASAAMTPRAPGAQASAILTRNLALAPAAHLDLADNALAWNYSTVSPVGTWNGSSYDQLSGYIASGQIFSSFSSGTFKMLGVAEASQALGLSGPDTTVFAGQTVDATTALVKFTYGGDANLDGKINIDDYIHIDSGIASLFTNWINGDFKYDGKINVDDYLIIDGNLSTQSGIL